MNAPTDAEIRKRLQALRLETETQSEATRHDRDPVALDQQSVGRLSRMDALQGQAMQMETERRRQQMLLRIDAALVRLDDGEFGFCISCGDDIDPKRLDNDLTVATCIRCASG